LGFIELRAPQARCCADTVAGQLNHALEVVQQGVQVIQVKMLRVACAQGFNAEAEPRVGIDTFVEDPRALADGGGRFCQCEMRVQGQVSVEIDAI